MFIPDKYKIQSKYRKNKLYENFQPNENDYH